MSGEFRPVADAVAAAAVEALPADSAVVQLPIEPLTVQTSEISQGEASKALKAVAEKVEQAAQRLHNGSHWKARDDFPTAQRRRYISQKQILPAGIALVLPTVVSEVYAIAKDTPAVFGTTLALTAVGLFAHSTNSAQVNKSAPVSVPDGYGIECLQARRDSSQFNKGEAVAFVHPRHYQAGEAQTPDQARKRLLDVLSVVEQAPSVDKVVLPASALRQAGITDTTRPYHETVNDLKLRVEVDIPYSEEERALVLDREAAQKLPEMLRPPNATTLIAQGVAALAERFQLARLDLAEALKNLEKNPRALQSLIHTLLQRTLDAQTTGAVREKGHEVTLVRVPQPDKDGQKQPSKFAQTPGRYYDRFSPVVTNITTEDPYNPQITQWNTGSYASADNRQLTQRIGLLGEQLETLPLLEDSADVKKLLVQLKEGIGSRGYSDLELIAVTLQVMGYEEKKRKGLVRVVPDAEPENEQKEQSNADETPAAALPGAEPVVITARQEKRISLRETLRLGRLGKAACWGAAGWMLFSGALIGNDAWDAAHETKPFSLPYEVTDADMVWRVSKFNMPASGYYAQHTYDHYDATKVAWSGTDPTSTPVTLPHSISTDKPRLLLSSVSNSPDVAIPVLEGTVLSSMSAVTHEGQAVPITTYRHGDNTYTTHANNNDAPYRMWYDLTPDPTFGQQNAADPYANRPLTVTDPEWNSFNTDDLEAQAKGWDASTYIQVSFTYDASTQLRDTLNATRSSQEYVHEIYNQGRCDCVECATAAALITHKDHPNEPVLLGEGYLGKVQPDADHTYLTPSDLHAWLVGPSGSGIDDVTALATDSRSNVPVGPPLAEMDKQMADGGWSMAAKAGDDTFIPAATAANTKPSARKPAKQLQTENQQQLARELRQFMLVNLGLLAAAGVITEAYTGTVRHTASWIARGGQWVVSNAVVHPNKMAAMMAWQEYGTDQALPDYGLDAKLPDVSNISDAALQEIAQGGLRQHPDITEDERRALQRQAKLILAERRAAERYAERVEDIPPHKKSVGDFLSTSSAETVTPRN